MNQLQIGFNRAMTQGPFGPMGPHSNIVMPNGDLINKVWQPNITLPHHGLDTWGLNPHNQYYKALTQFRLHKHKPRISPCCLGCFSYVSILHGSHQKKTQRCHEPVEGNVWASTMVIFPSLSSKSLAPHSLGPVNSHGDVKTNIHLHTFAIL
jgi:hypothetical protein